MVTFKVHSTDPYNKIGKHALQEMYQLAKRGLVDYWIRYGSSLWEDEIDIFPGAPLRYTLFIRPQAA